MQFMKITAVLDHVKIPQGYIIAIQELTLKRLCSFHACRVVIIAWDNCELCGEEQH